MHTILLKVENDGAEKLWSYILAYREMMRKGKEATQKEPKENAVTFVVQPPLEQIKVSRNKKKTQSHSRLR